METKTNFHKNYLYKIFKENQRKKRWKFKLVLLMNEMNGRIENSKLIYLSILNVIYIDNKGN